MENKTIEIAKDVITDELKKAGFDVIKILLFGSRVRGDYKEDSDWDFLVVLDKDISFPQSAEITGEIQMRLAEYKIPNDVILDGINQFEEACKTVGNISYYASREGVVV